MGLLQKDIEKVHAFVRNELKGKEYDLFLKNMKEDDNILEEVMFQKRIANATKLNMVKEAMANAANFNAKENETLAPQKKTAFQHSSVEKSSEVANKSVTFFYIYSASIAACFLLVCYIGLKSYVTYGFEQEINSLSQKFIKQDVSDDSNELKEVSGRSDFILVRYGEAVDAYKQKQWSTSLSILEQIKEQSYFENNHILVFKSILYIKMEEYGKSISILENINFLNQELACEANHYLSYSYLKNDYKNKAKDLFNTMSNEFCGTSNQMFFGLRKYFL